MKSEHSTDWNRLEPLPARNSPHAPLIEAINHYLTLQRRRFHVPAHAGEAFLPLGLDLVRRDPYGCDLSEVEGLDVLSEPSGRLLEAQERAAALYGVSRSFFLVNGASVGLMAAMLAAVKPGDAVLLPRNVHRSVLGGLILSGARPVWMLPERLPDWGLWGAVEAREVEKRLEDHPGIRALFLTSPTYEGIGSDIPAIAAVCRRYGVLLVVDEAHGGLWPFSENLPPSACSADVDVVVHSLHKSAGSLTQSAMAHLPRGSRMDGAVFQQALNTLQTTSPSYLLMASLDATCAWLGTPAFRERLEAHLRRVHQLRRAFTERVHGFRLFAPESSRACWDPCKLYLVRPDQSGESWGPHMESVGGIAYESASPYGVLYLANIGLAADDFRAFLAAFEAEGECLGPTATEEGHWHALQTSFQEEEMALPEMVMTPRDAFFSKAVDLPAEHAAGKVARQTVVHCPPGIPVLVPGERIQARHLPQLPESVQVVAE